jgi:porphobilinogen synthase
MTELEISKNPQINLSSSISRPRRLRFSEGLRLLSSETDISPRRFIVPIFVQEGSGIREEIESMPGVFRFSPDLQLDSEIEEINGLGIKAVLIFGIPKKKDLMGSEAYNSLGVAQQAISRIKQSYPEMVVIGDVCMCEYTDHGHCGILNSQGQVENDKTIELLGKIAVSQAESGADMVAPSAMMDNQVISIRRALDRAGFDNTAIMAYSAKYASAFYGPFREAAASAPSFGDRKSYQMNSSNVREAIREVELDIEQGADMIMVKPALSYLDVIRAVREKFTLPLAAYNVSGEYSMIKAAARNGWLDERNTIREILTSIRRAGADIIITYFAKDFLSNENNSR